jgi:hypothetical protein
MRAMVMPLSAFLQDFDSATPPGRLLRFVAIARPAGIDAAEFHSSWKPAGGFPREPIITLRKIPASTVQPHQIRRGLV